MLLYSGHMLYEKKQYMLENSLEQFVTFLKLHFFLSRRLRRNGVALCGLTAF